MKRGIVLSLIIISFTCTAIACSDSGQGITTGTPDPNSQRYAEGPQGSSTTDPATRLAAGIAKALLGGIIQGKITYNDLPTAEVDTSKSASISVPFEGESLSTNRLFDFGTLKINTTGNYEIIRSSNAAGPVYYAAPITTELIMENYPYANTCTSDITLNGRFSCSIRGHYTVETRRFLGTATCSTPAGENATPITVTQSGTQINVRIDANLSIHGEALSQSGNTAQGKIYINDQEFKIEDLASIDC